MKRTLKFVVLIFTIIVFVTRPVLAAPTAQDVQNQKQQLQQDKSELKKAQEKRFEIEQRIEELDGQVEEIMSQVDNNKKQIAKAQQDIKTAEQELKTSEDNLRKQQELFNKRMRAMYINGVSGYLEILLGSTGFNDFLSRVEAVKNVIGMDKKVTETMKAKQEELNNKKVALKNQQVSLLALNDENNKKMVKLKESKDEQNELIKEAESHEKLLAMEVNESQAQLNETLRQIAAIRSSAPKYTPSRGAAIASSNAVVAYASNFLGTPYKWGGTTPAGFDCSGFTQYVYKHFGISLGRATYNQINNGYAVSRDQLQPGDLVFYGRGGSPSHMGIYVGNGMYIHSPRTGDVIKISPYDRADYITARRVMN